jgi:Tol biopolymer transport system component
MGLWQSNNEIHRPARPAWTQDGSDIVFASAFKGNGTLWRISARGGTPRRVAGAGEAWAPSTSRSGDLLAYWVWKQWDTIWRLDVKDERHPLGPPVRLLSGRGVVWKPSYSPDGKKIAFESNREGYLDIWVCDNDGSNCSQLTSTRQGQSGTPRWSPDGRYIAFESITQGFYEVYIVEVAGGTPRFVPTFPEGNNGAPNWSRDGQWIYFYSAHERGPYQLWKVPFQGPPVRVTKNGGVYASESHDGQFVYYAKFNEPGLWRMPLNGGEETHVLDQPKNWASWALARTGIYYLNLDVPPHGRIEFFDFGNRQSTPIISLDKAASLWGGLAISADGKSLLFGQREYDESYVMLMKNFH